MKSIFSLLQLTLAIFTSTAAILSAAEPIAAPNQVGRTIAPFSLQDFRGKAWPLDELQGNKATIIAYLGVECPIAAQYASRLKTLAEKYAGSGIAFAAIDSNQQDSLAEIAHFARTHELEFPVLRDPGNKIADQFGATRTPEVFLLVAYRNIVFHGRIHDQFTYGIQRSKIEHQYLVDAIDQLLSGDKIAATYAEPVGCLIGRLLTSKTDTGITYSKHIARILQDNCVKCHRPGEIGPFALTNYDEVVGWAEMIREVVDQQRMPPWHANPQYGHFVNDARLSDADKKLIAKWIEAGAPEGDKADLPPPREFTVGWQIREPDQIVYMSEKPFDVPAKGEVRYQYFLVDPGFTEDKWVKAAECRPGNRSVVHHIIVGIVPPGAKLGGGDFVGGWLAATAPGARPMILREGMAKKVPAGSRFVFQMHYTPNGTAQQDRSCIGIVFADPTTIHKVVATEKAANPRFRIPPGDPNYKVEANTTLSRDTVVLSLMPHMHVRGKAFRYTAFYPGGEQEILLDVPHYDFNWQNSYEFVEPKLMPKGTRVYCEAWFDNSEGNLANPDPTKEVRWGDQTWEEMMIGYFAATAADQGLQKTP